MTTTDLREILVATARAYMGANSYNGQKQEIIDIYNKTSPDPEDTKCSTVTLGALLSSALWGTLRDFPALYSRSVLALK